MRVPGAEYGPLRVTRGRGGADRPAALLAAEAAIAAEMERRPEDAELAELQARANVVEGGRFNEAIPALEDLLEERPDDAAARLDLASAYFERAQALNRPVDYGKAVDQLGRVLEAEPGNEVALFNRAVALERLALYGQAESAWKKYLEKDGSGGWADEARDHLRAVQEIVRRRKERTGKPLETPGTFAAEVARGEKAKLAELDGRVERYLEAAREEWLPKAFPAEGGVGDAGARAGLEELARLMVERHGDRWLEDLMTAGRGDPHFGREVELLARGYRASMAGDDDQGEADASEALAGLTRAHNAAGEMEAGWQKLYAVRLGLRDGDCLAMGERQWRAVEKTKYEWLRVRSLLDYAECAEGDGRKGLGARLAAMDAKEGLERGFGDLYLRALNAMAAGSGETSGGASTYALDVEGLRRFWSGDFDPMAGYNLSVGLDDSAEAMGLWRMDAAAIEEALALIEHVPDRWMRAAEQERLASALERCGRLREADEVLKRAEEQLRPGRAGEAMENRLADIETGIAGIELASGESARAVERLEKIGATVKRMSNADAALPFYTVYGEALEARGERQKAGEAFASAIGVAEAALRSYRLERERFEWSRRSERAYRDMVELKLKDDPEGALEWWERFRGASLGAGRRTTGEGEAAATAAVAVYLEGKNDVGVWVRDRSGWQYRRLIERNAAAMRRVRRFAARCADPGTKPEWLRSEGEWVYGALVAPVEGLLRGHARLIVEPDGELDGLPFEALVDRAGRYVGERYRVSYSPGMAYLEGSGVERAYGARSRALVVGDAEAHPQLDLGALPAAETEAREVAANFRGAKLLLGGEATAAAIARDMPGAEIFHFAGHAIADANRAGLVVGGEGSEGVYGADEMMRGGGMRTRLAVLSACASARGTEGGFSDGESVARRMVAAGVGQVVASRWPVDSAAAQAAMKMFYGSLAGGKTAGEALGETQRRMRASREWAHPYYWAAFAMFGGG